MPRLDRPIPVDREMLRDATTRYVRDRFTAPARRARTDGWAADVDVMVTAQLGWYAMLASEDVGGGSVTDEPVADLVAIAVEHGRHLVPGSLISTNVVVDSLQRAGTTTHLRARLPAVVSGDERATWVIAGPSGSSEPAAIRSVRHGDTTRLNGTAGAVQDPGQADWFLVTAAADQDVAHHLVPRDAPGLCVSTSEGLDLSRTFGTVTLDEVAVDDDAVLAGCRGDELLRRQVDLANLLVIADMTGAMAADFAMALEHARTRTAFGRPIGSFQALKHLLADTSLLLEASTAMLAAAARDFDDAGGSATVSSAKSFVGESAITLAQHCFQVFGGIGFTWEHAQHLYLRRLTANAVLFGDAAWHRRRLFDAAYAATGSR